MLAIMAQPWIPVLGADAVKVRGFTCDVDTNRLDE